MGSVYVDGLLVAVLRPAVAPATMMTLQPVDLLTSMPCLVAKHVGGAGVVDPRFPSTRAVVQVDAYAAGKRASFDLAAAARGALLAAWRAQTMTPDGCIARFAPQSEPDELRLPEQADGFTRYTALYGLTIRA